MNKIKLTALPCICADVFYGTEIIRPGGEALNFAAVRQQHHKFILKKSLNANGADNNSAPFVLRQQRTKPA